MTARRDDYDAIVPVMQLYVDGFNECDISKFKDAFDKDTRIFYIDADGVRHKSLISDYFENWAKPPSQGLWAGSSR